MLFFIQRYVERKDNEQNLLFQIYSMLENRSSIRSPEIFFENIKRHKNIKNLSFLIKDKNLRKDIFLYVRNISSGDIKNPPKKEDLLKKIRQKLNKKFVKEIENSLSKYKMKKDIKEDKEG